MFVYPPNFFFSIQFYTVAHFYFSIDHIHAPPAPTGLSYSKIYINYIINYSLRNDFYKVRFDSMLSFKLYVYAQTMNISEYF